jgi:hypothetical protein
MKYSLFIAGKAYMVQADALEETERGLVFKVDDKVVGRFLWAKIDGYMEVK